MCDLDSRVCVAGDISDTESLEEPIEESEDETSEQSADGLAEELEDDPLELPLGEPHPILDDTGSDSDFTPPTSDGDLPSPDRPLTPDL